MMDLIAFAKYSLYFSHILDLDNINIFENNSKHIPLENIYF